MAFHTNYARNHANPKAGKCEIGFVTQDYCYHKPTVTLEVGLKRGPIHLCAKCAERVQKVLGSEAKFVGRYDYCPKTKG